MEIINSYISLPEDTNPDDPRIGDLGMIPHLLLSSKLT
jgi:hypothetical protein